MTLSGKHGTIKQISRFFRLFIGFNGEKRYADRLVWKGDDFSWMTDFCRKSLLFYR